MPVNINGTDYKLVLLDTNVVSEMLKKPQERFRTVLEAFPYREYAHCISPFSIVEIRRRTDLWTLFLDHYSALPIVMLKGYEELFQLELARYPGPHDIDPTSLVPSAITPEVGLSRRETIDKLFSIQEFTASEARWNAAQQDILNGMLTHVRNFPPDAGQRFTPERLAQFIEIVSVSQVMMRNMRWAKTMVKRKKVIDTNAFRSVRAMTWTVFYKFYADNRVSVTSDVFDILIASALPYVDAFVTERHQAEVLRKAKQRDAIFAGLDVRTLSEVVTNGGSPRAAGLH